MLGLPRDGFRHMLLDGHNNPGFSGGPVDYAKPGETAAKHVAGVISGYRFQMDRVLLGEKETDLTVKFNTGIIIAYPIDHAIDLIKFHPVGAVINA